MNLLLIHGRSQGGKSPAKLQAEWLEALDGGFKKSKLKMPADVNIQFPFYADVLDGFVAQFDVPTGAEVTAKGGAMDNDYAQFRADVAEELRKKAGISVERVKKEAGKEVAAKRALRTGNGCWQPFGFSTSTSRARVTGPSKRF